MNRMTRKHLIITRYIFWLIFAVLIFLTGHHTIAVVIVFAIFVPVFIYLDRKIQWHWPWRKKA